MVSDGGGASETTEPASGSSTGTDVSLRLYVDTRFRALDAAIHSLQDLVEQRLDLNDKALTAALSAAEKAVDKALDAAKEAVDKAQVASEKRFDAVNEFRGQLSDILSTTMPREVAESKIHDLATKIDALTARVDTTAGRAQGSDRVLAGLVAASTLVITVAVIVVNVLLR